MPVGIVTLNEKCEISETERGGGGVARGVENEWTNELRFTVLYSKTQEKLSKACHVDPDLHRTRVVSVLA